MNAKERGGWACGLTLCLAVAGCGGNEAPSPVTQASVQNAPAPGDAPALIPAATRDATPVVAAPPAGQPEVQPAISGRAAEAWERLNSPGLSPQEWEQAQLELLQLEDESVSVLTAALRSGTAVERELAASLMMQLGPDVPGASAPLVAALSDESQYVRANAATALCFRPGHEEQVVPVLTALLTSDDPQLRELAATNLSNFGPEAAACVPQLTAALEQAPPEMLRPIVELLGRIGPAAEPARPKLQQIAFEQDGDASAAATAALELIGPPQ